MKSHCLSTVARAAAIVLAVSGCGQTGPRLNPVKGTILVNKKPAPEALVFMHRTGRTSPEEQVPFGRAGQDGTFRIMNGTSGEGAPEGEYRITVYWPDMSKPEDRTGGRPDALNGAYENPANSTISFVVKPGQNTLPTLDLTPGPARPNSGPNPLDK